MLEYDASLFTEARVVQWVTRFVRTLDQTPALSAATTPVDTLSLLDEAERHQVLELFNRTEVTSEDLTEDAQSYSSIATPPATTLPELFEQQVTRTPEATALVFGEDTLTYAELNARANQLARHLIDLGIGPEQIVALALPRSIEIVVALLAVLKSGAAYLPLDPDYPTARLTFMLGDSNASLLITQAGIIKEALDALEASGTTLPILELNNASAQATLAKLDQAPVTQAERISALTPLNLSYLIYTSGSTGQPKAAGNTHRGGSNFVDELITHCGYKPSARVLQFSSFAFDASFLEIMPALASGATL
jgi:non-ribosomal peptide synthetase component F